MGKKSIKENKNVYQISRENAGLTREKASEEMVYVSADRIEKIENERTAAHPDDIMAMAKCYKDPSLCNYYCSHECPIGQEYVPPLKPKDITQITLEILSGLNTMESEKNRLIDITADSNIDESEIQDFIKIRKKLEQISVSVDSLRLWIDREIASGNLDSSVLAKDE
ncbi:MAG: helix-turn-helix transcriptional regulator [Butyrivibrio sp.]|nr:helix-turn-helix transcriptional regulator [Butyrivibrio sp.]